MKNILFLSILLIAATNAWSQTNVTSQTNAVAPTDAKSKTEKKDIDIRSQHFYFTEEPRQLVYYDHVVITNSQLRLTCERFTVNFPAQGADNHPTNGIAETNLDIVFVDEKGRTNHTVSDKGIYDYGVNNGQTNEMLTFTGHVTNYTANGWMTAEPLRYDVISGRISGDGEEMHFTVPAGNGTNSSPFKFGS